MEVRRAAEALLRAQSTLSIRTLTSISQSWRPLHRPILPQQHTALLTHARPTRFYSQAAAAVAPAPEETDNNSSEGHQGQQQGQPPRPPQPSPESPEISSLLTPKDMKMPAPRPRSGRFDRGGFGGFSSFDSSAFSDSSSSRNPNGAEIPAFEDHTIKNLTAASLGLPLKLGSNLGRTVAVDSRNGVDLSRAITRLNIQVSVNKIRQHVRLQRFHERGGLKRKRLNSERWRKRFRGNFDGIVKRVIKLKGKGW
ncbi:hypothetical protein K402DRAFT_392740 [Aulographum hederae CBS 113979]|uniref:Ribosomal protein S21 n=1 Tax=Aulographum hederae CBS 113979 TaxID=1176131 RepID=A0A6G1H3D9_9PEZI|nr:hypothetical protein K402DRAFT_392740 [Aulographum hederae CBS 113979]